MDEAEIAKQKYISVLVGSLHAPNQTFLVDFHPLDSGSNVNSSIVLHTVEEFFIVHDWCCSVHVFGWKDIKGIIPVFDACHLGCALTT